MGTRRLRLDLKHLMSLTILHSPQLIRNVPCCRTFTTKSCCLKATGPLPTFPATSNSELDQQLKFILDEHFIPSHLIRRHRNLMHRPRNHHILNEEPLIVDISGHLVTLKPKGPQISVPLNSFSRAISLMKEPSDLNVIPGLLEGYAQSNQLLRDKQLEMLARTVALSGRWDLLMQISRSAKDYRHGFKFTQPVAREFMRGLWIRNQLPVRAQVIKSLKDGEELLQIFRDTQYKKDPSLRLKRDPVVLGTFVAMLSSANIRFNEGKDFEESTKKYTQLLQDAWQGVLLDLGLVNSDKKSVVRAKFALLDYMPVLDGMMEAKIILAGLDIERWLTNEHKRLAEAITTWEKFVVDHKKAEGRTLALYRRISEALGEKLAVGEI